MYPLDGSDLVPEMLRPFIGNVPLKPGQAARLGLERALSLGDITSAELQNLSRGSVVELVQLTRDALSRVLLEVRRSTIPVDLSSVSEERARERLSLRAFNVALRAQLLTLPWLNRVPLGLIASEEGMGAATLLEVLALASLAESATEERGEPHLEPLPPPTPAAATARRPSRAVAKTARTLARRRWAPLVLRTDPRLGSHFNGLSVIAEDARELAEAVAALEMTPSEARVTNARLRALIKAGDALRRLTVEAEAEELLDAIVPRSLAGREALRHRFGLVNGVPTTLAAAGDAAGITRERVRQVEQMFTNSVRVSAPWTPALDKALALIGAHAIPIDEVTRLLADENMTGYLTLPSLMALAQAMTSTQLELRVDYERGVAYSGDLPLSQIDVTAKRLATHWGTTTVEEVAAEIAEPNDGFTPTVVRAALKATRNFAWLDNDENWFWAPRGSRNRLLGQIEKIMSVAGTIDLTELREGVGRFHRMKGFRPPREVLARLCVDTGLYTREGDRIIEGLQLRPWEEVLVGNERLLAEVLFEHGPVMRREDLERIACDERGLNRRSFYVYLSYSPILARFAPSVFGLRGARVGAAEVDALIPPRVRTQRLRRHGWTPEGHLWIVYDISSASAHSGVLTLPSELQEFVSGSFTLRTEDDRPVGTLVARGASMWGLSPFFRRWGVEGGDYILITVNLTAGDATIAAGAEELLLRYQSGE